MRVLKMHSLMPRILRKATEPPQVFVKDYSIDVKAHAKRLVEQIEMELKPEKNSETASSSDSESSQRDPKKEESVKAGSQN